MLLSVIDISISSDATWGFLGVLVGTVLAGGFGWWDRRSRHREEDRTAVETAAWSLAATVGAIDAMAPAIQLAVRRPISRFIATAMTGPWLAAESRVMGQTIGPIRARQKRYPRVWKATSELTDHVRVTCSQATGLGAGAFGDPEWAAHQEELTEMLTALTDAVEAECD